jgi:hypothetical protein
MTGEPQMRIGALAPSKLKEVIENILL